MFCDDKKFPSLEFLINRYKNYLNKLIKVWFNSNVFSLL